MVRDFIGCLHLSSVLRVMLPRATITLAADSGRNCQFGAHGGGGVGGGGGGDRRGRKGYPKG
jgi:hypothetical protein